MTEIFTTTAVLLPFVVGAALLVLVRSRSQRQSDLERSWFVLRFPRDLTADDVTTVVRSLASTPRPSWHKTSASTVFEIRAERGELTHFLGIPKRVERLLLAQLRASQPDLRIQLAERPALPRGLYVTELRLTTPHRSLRTDLAEEQSQALLSSIQELSTSCMVVVQWCIGPWVRREPTHLPTAAEKRRANAEILPIRFIQGLMHASSEPAQSEEVSARRKKHEEVLLQAVGRIAVAGRREPIARHDLVRLVGVHQLVRASGVGLVQRRVRIGSPEKRVRLASTPLYRWTGSLNAAELTALIGWPIGDRLLQGVARGGARLLAPPKDALRPSGSNERIVGNSVYPGLAGDVVQRPADALFHTHVIGPTGTGKSTLLANLILSDIRAGRGVVVVDPKADLLSDVIQRIPRDLLHLSDGSPRVVVLDPGDRTRPVGFNPLAVPKGVSPELVVDQLVHAFHELYASSWGPRTADVLNASLLTLTRVGSATLVDLPLLLTNASYRRSVTTGLNDPFGLSPFWSWYESLSDDMRIAVIGPVLNKIRAFTMRPDLRAVIGQLDPAWSWLDVPIKKRVVFVSLAKGKLGPELSSLFGSLATSSLWQAMQLRSRIDPSRRSPVMIYLDEFQDYLRISGDMGDALVQARGLGAAFTVAHQHLGQLGQLRGAVLTNARSRIVLQTTPQDGRSLATTLGGGLTADDLQGLARYEAYASLVVNGAVRPPASITTLPLGGRTGVESDVHRLSREAFGRTPAEVDRLLQERLSEREGPASVVGRKSRGRA